MDDATVRALQERGLGKYVGPVRETLQRAPDELLRVTEAVGGGSVDPVHAEFERPMDGGDRLLVLLGAPAELPTAAADGPGAEPDAGYLEAGLAELCAL